MAVFLRFKPFTGSLVYRFVDPDSSYQYVAGNKTDLLRAIISYRVLNQLPAIEHLDMVLDQYLCGLPENCGACEPYELKRGFLATIKGGVSLLEWMLFPNDHTASQEQADIRAAQCATCPKNIFPDRTCFIKWSDDIALACIGDKRSYCHDMLGHCSVCQCVLRAKVFYTGDMRLTPDQIAEMKTVSCWQLEEVK